MVYKLIMGMVSYWAYQIFPILAKPPDLLQFPLNLHVWLLRLPVGPPFFLRPVTTPGLLIVHFMGGSKNFAPEILCGDPSYTGEAPDGYGCAGRA